MCMDVGTTGKSQGSPVRQEGISGSFHAVVSRSYPSVSQVGACSALGVLMAWLSLQGFDFVV